MKRKALDYLLRLVIVAVCLGYVYYKVDWVEFLKAMKTFGIVPIVGVTVLSFVQYALTGLRLNFLTGYAAGFPVCFKASLFCLGINNIVPAKLGEVAKAFYLRKEAGIPLGQSLGLIFWERFFDLNCLLIMGLLATLMLGVTKAILPLVAVVGIIWTGVVVFRLFPGVPRFLSRLLPGERLRLLLMDVVRQLQDKTGIRPFLALGGWSAIVWASFVGVTSLGIHWIGDLPLSPAQTLMIFVFASLGFAVPGTPGGLGVYEAAFLYALDLMGFDSAIQSRGMALALVIHAIIFIPPIISALIVMNQSGLTMKTIRERGEEDL